MINIDYISKYDVYDNKKSIIVIIIAAERRETTCFHFCIKSNVGREKAESPKDT